MNGPYLHRVGTHWSFVRLMGLIRSKRPSNRSQHRTARRDCMK